MAHGHRQMIKITPSTWLVKCRICPNRDTSKYFNSAKAAHDYWREHVQTKRHIWESSKEGREARTLERAKVRALFG